MGIDDPFSKPPTILSTGVFTTSVLAQVYEHSKPWWLPRFIWRYISKFFIMRFQTNYETEVGPWPYFAASKDETINWK